MEKVQIPQSHADLMTQKKAFAHLATVMPDGTPHVTPVWFDTANGNIRVNTARGRVKDRNMRQNAAVALSILDPENPYRHVAIRGRVVNMIEEGEADPHIDSLAKKYLGEEKYSMRRPGEARVIFEIEPTFVAVMG